MKKELIPLATLLGLGLAVGPLWAGSEPEEPFEAPRFGPRLGVEEVWRPVSPLTLVEARGQMVPGVRTEVYGFVEAHPLVAEAAEILTRRLTPYAEGVYVTSVARTPEDQRRLMKTQHTRGWAIPRSKHLMGGMAADIGFVARRVSTWRMRDVAEQILIQEMGPARASLVRVVREARCIHIEIDSRRGRELLKERMALLADLGVLHTLPDDKYPVPRLRHYVKERNWHPPGEVVALAY